METHEQKKNCMKSMTIIRGLQQDDRHNAGRPFPSFGFEPLPQTLLNFTPEER
jgi:hypothetical protein